MAKQRKREREGKKGGRVAGDGEGVSGRRTKEKNECSSAEGDSQQKNERLFSFTTKSCDTSTNITQMAIDTRPLTKHISSQPSYPPFSSLLNLEGVNTHSELHKEREQP